MSPATSTGRRTAAAVTAALVLFAACGGGSDDAASSASVATPAAETPAVESADGSVPDASISPDAVFVPLADGTRFDFNSLQGQDVLLWFWAPW